LRRAVAPHSAYTTTGQFQHQPRQPVDLHRIAGREIGNPIDLIRGKTAGHLARAELAANKGIDLIAAELVQVEADRSLVFEQVRLQVFEPEDEVSAAEKHAGRTVAAGCQIAAEFLELPVGQSVRLVE
jgi:hypothetical protein